MLKILAYIGPETMLPVASALAAVVGALLLGWRWVVAGLRSGWRFVMRKPDLDAEAPAPTLQAPDLGEHPGAASGGSADAPTGPQQ